MLGPMGFKARELEGEPIKARIKPAAYDKHGPLFRADEVHAMSAKDINESNHFQRRTKNMSVDFEKARMTVEDASKLFSTALTNMIREEEKISEASRKVSGQVRKAASDLADGLNRIQKTANFPALEKYVDLLERAAAALTTLADLEKSGKLDRIATAIK